jgi:hypothetical protein
MATISPPPTSCFALFVEFRQLLKKYLALFIMHDVEKRPASDQEGHLRQRMSRRYLCAVPLE